MISQTYTCEKIADTGFAGIKMYVLTKDFGGFTLVATDFEFGNPAQGGVKLEENKKYKITIEELK